MSKGKSAVNLKNLLGGFVGEFIFKLIVSSYTYITSYINSLYIYRISSMAYLRKIGYLISSITIRHIKKIFVILD